MKPTICASIPHRADILFVSDRGILHISTELQNRVGNDVTASTVITFLHAGGAYPLNPARDRAVGRIRLDFFLSMRLGRLLSVLDLVLIKTALRPRARLRGLGVTNNTRLGPISNFMDRHPQ